MYTVIAAAILAFLLVELHVWRTKRRLRRIRRRLMGG